MTRLRRTVIHMAMGDTTKRLTAFRLDDEDRGILDELKGLTGVASAAEVVRMALRVLLTRERTAVGLPPRASRGKRPKRAAGGK